MKQFFIIFFLTITGTVLLFNSCKKDSTTANKGSAVFWFGKGTSDTLVASGNSTLTFYFDSLAAGSVQATTYFTGAPSCGQKGAITIEKDLGDQQSKTYYLNVVDQEGTTIWHLIPVTIKTNSCVSRQLWYY